MSRFAARPLVPDTWDHLVEVFGGGDGRGECGRCWCMWWRLPRTPGSFGQSKGNKALFRERVEAGPPPGLVGFADGEPVGWVQIGPRADVPEWNVAGRLTAPADPGDARDPSVWGISCFVIRAGRRRKGHAGALLDAAVDWARGCGAACIDACPVEVEVDGKRTATALYHGTASMFRTRGFREIARRRHDRPLMRLDV